MKNGSLRSRIDPNQAFDDWESVISDSNGIDLAVCAKRERIILPSLLKKAYLRLHSYIDANNSYVKVYNGDRFCIVKFAELKRTDERRKYKIYLKRSDYFSFLVTNGMTLEWAKITGLHHIWDSPTQWFNRWEESNSKSSFFFNSFGLYVLITVRDSKNEKVAIFRERSDSVAVNSNFTLGSVDIGLKDKKDWFMNSREREEITIDLRAEVELACKKECGFDLKNHKSDLKLLSVGKSKSLQHYGLLCHLDLELSKKDFIQSGNYSAESGIQFDDTHFVKFDKDKILQFLEDMHRNNKPPVPYLLPMSLLALGPKALRKTAVFLSYSIKDEPEVKKIANYLETNEFKVFNFRENIKYGENFPKKIVDTINSDCDYFLLFNSNNSLLSEWVQIELELAIKRENKTKSNIIIPLLLDQSSLPEALISKNSVDLIDLERKPGNLDKLVRELRNM